MYCISAHIFAEASFVSGIGGAVKGANATAGGGTGSGLEMWVANLGDCAAVVCREGKALAVSNSHKPDRPDEKQRILDAGGWITEEKELFMGQLHRMDLQVGRISGDIHAFLSPTAVYLKTLT